MCYFRLEYKIIRLVRLRRVDRFGLLHHPAVGVHNACPAESAGIAASKSEQMSFRHASLRRRLLRDLGRSIQFQRWTKLLRSDFRRLFQKRKSGFGFCYSSLRKWVYSGIAFLISQKLIEKTRSESSRRKNSDILTRSFASRFLLRLKLPKFLKIIKE